ncbi:hypothetical protein [Aquiflexum gelatinilyticum]|uniref:Uncharacterized protein n=1 Tax=Aquiflexum gelatinilyticum TaxID=2961943 RepID=A0A9X2T076_9BACT|nr:hypothetical protein [Aquiflexum gelatinilyticum]MCR9014631.1 hypothetical protein [Aquiflexum gelatinilyticum]
MDGLEIQPMMEGIISLLLTIITYHLSSISREMKQFKKDYSELRNTCNGLISEQVSIRTKLDGLMKKTKRKPELPD